MRIHRVLCPVDFSENAHRALRFAASIAGWYEARLDVIHCFLGLLPPTLPVDTIVHPDRESIRQATHDALRAFITSAGVTQQVTTALPEALPVKGILAYAAEARADLIVLGTHGRTAAARALIGSTTEHVLHLARCPVLTVPPASASHDAAEPIRFKHILLPGRLLGCLARGRAARARPRGRECRRTDPRSRP